MSAKKNCNQWISFETEIPKEDQRVIIAEQGYGAYDTYFEFDSEADYSRALWCPWPLDELLALKNYNEFQNLKNYKGLSK